MRIVRFLHAAQPPAYGLLQPPDRIVPIEGDPFGPQ